MKKYYLVALILVLATLAFVGCGGGGNGGNNSGGGDNGGDGIFQATTEDYFGTWRWEDPEKCQYSIVFSVCGKIEDWVRGSYHQGSMECEIFGYVTINGDINDLSYIQLLIDPGIFQHGITVRAFQEMSPTHNVTVELAGQLTEPGVISVYSLSIQENGGSNFSYLFESGAHNNDEVLLFTLVPPT